jgi:hypothetical protein
MHRTVIEHLDRYRPTTHQSPVRDRQADAPPGLLSDAEDGFDGWHLLVTDADAAAMGGPA